MFRVYLYAVAGREAAGRRPAGVDQQGVSDRGDIRGGQEHPDPHQIQVAIQTLALCGLSCGPGKHITISFLWENIQILSNDATCIQSKMTLLP